VHLNKQTYNLFVFEGEKTEPQIFNSLRKYFFNEKENEHISISYCNNIYHLAKEIYENEYLDFFELLKEEGKIDNALKRDNVARIYLLIMMVMPIRKVVKNFKRCYLYLTMRQSKDCCILATLWEKHLNI